MTDREEFEAWMGFVPERDKYDDYDDEETQMCWNVWQGCTYIKQRRIDELEAQLRQVKAGSGGIAQNSPAGGHGMSGHRVSFAEPITMVYGGRGGITQDVNGPTHPEPLEPI